MAANPPREVTRQREIDAWTLRQQCWTEQRIAERLGIDQATVSRMLARIRERLTRALQDQAAEVRAEQTAQLSLIADEALQAWERSKLNAESSRAVTEEIELKADEETLDDDGEPVRRKKVLVPATKTTRTATVEGQTGDPRFLDQARGALKDIRAIWGLDAPKKTDITTGGQPLKAYGLVDPEDL